MTKREAVADIISAARKGNVVALANIELVKRQAERGEARAFETLQMMLDIVRSSPITDQG